MDKEAENLYDAMVSGSDVARVAVEEAILYAGQIPGNLLDHAGVHRKTIMSLVSTWLEENNG